MPETEFQYTLERLASDVYDHLGNPKGGANKLGSVYQRLLGRIEYYSTYVQAFGGNWILSRAELTLQQGKLEYDVAEPDFSRPLLCEVVPPSQPGLTPYEPVTVDIVNLEDLNRLGPAESVSLSGSFGNSLGDVGGQVTPRAVAFWVEDGAQKLRFNASPRSGIKVRFFYKPAVAANFDPQAEPEFLRQFFEMLSIATALRCLALFDFDDRTYSRLQSDLTLTLSKHEELLSRYIANDHEETAGPIRGYGGQRSQSSPFTLWR